MKVGDGASQPGPLMRPTSDFALLLKPDTEEPLLKGEADSLLGQLEVV